jgi:hypothetical protein
MNKLNRERYTTAMMQWERKKYPNTAERYLLPDKTNDKDANSLTKCIINYLRANGWQAERINTMGRPVDTRKQVTDVVGMNRTIGSMKWIKGSGTRGSADISSIIRGLPVKIEVKWGRDRQSNDQKAYEADIVAAGGHYWLVRDFDEFIDRYDHFIKYVAP